MDTSQRRQSSVIQPSSPLQRLLQQWNRLAQALQQLLGDSLLSLAARLAVAAIFLLSGRT